MTESPPKGTPEGDKDTPPKPEYRPNTAHDRRSPDYNPNKDPEPPDAEEVYRNAQSGGREDGRKLLGQNKNGEWYQYHKDGLGELITPVEVSEVMHNIGDKTVFATEFRWDKTPHLYRPWMYGVFCVYINGERLGSPTNQATLSDILVGLNGWKGAVGQRSDPVLMEADAQTAFFSMENEVYGLEHVEHLLPSGFQPLPVRHNGPYQILDVDGLEDFKVYCVEDETTSRLLYCRMWEHVKECRIPRKIFNDVMFRTIDQLEEWFSQLPEDPARNRPQK